MVDITRRQVLQSGAAAGLLLLPDGVARAAPTWNGPAPEPGASIRVLRWKQFIQAEFDSFVANTKKFTEQTGVKVRSTRKAGTTSGRKRRSPPMSALDPTSSWARSTIRSSSAKSSST